MIDTVFATKKGMTQAWDSSGKRLAISKFLVEANLVVGEKTVKVKADKQDASSWQDQRVVEIGYGGKKLKNMAKAMRSRLEKLSWKTGVKQIDGVRETAKGEALVVGQPVPVGQIVKVGDVVQVQGVTKGRGFGGGMKRHGFHGGPKTHGQSDRARAVGSVGNRTTPGRVFPGKRLPGHYGVETQTVSGLVVAYFNEQTGELWLTGPVPGAFNGLVKIKSLGKSKKNFALDQQASGIVQEEKKQDSAAKAESLVKEAPAEGEMTAESGEKEDKTVKVEEEKQAKKDEESK